VSEPTLELLFDEFATSYLRGERPDVGVFLERAGAERDELGLLLDRFLEAVPARASSEEEIVALQARLEQQPPLLVLRLRRALRREAVVEALVSRLGLDPAKSGKVGGYYADLEVGILDPKPVDRRVWDVLAEVLGANARALAGGMRPEAPPLAAAYHREPALMLREALIEAPESAAAAPAEPDEVDRLFTASA
jgi:hypothetical protein